MCVCALTRRLRRTEQKPLKIQLVETPGCSQHEGGRRKNPKNVAEPSPRRDFAHRCDVILFN